MASKQPAASKAPISLKPSKAASPIASKTTMNFVHHQKSFSLDRIMPLILVLVIGALLLLKFGIIDQLDKKSKAMNQLAAKQEQLLALSGSLQEYDRLSAEYGRYSYGWMSEAEVGAVDRYQILNLIEEKVANMATIENISINNNILSMNIRGVNLNQAGIIVVDLESHELVSRATVHSASADTGRDASIFMTVVFEKGEE